MQVIYDTQLVLTRLEYEHWLTVLFSWVWWLLLATLVIPWIVWWRLADKQRVFEVFACALLVVVIGTTIDIYGVRLGLWSYNINLYYLNPALIAGDFALPPVIKSLIYQYYPDWRRYVAAQIIMAAVFSFVLEPLLGLTQVYVMHRWNYIYSFPIYFGVAVTAKWLIDTIKIQAARSRPPGSS